MAKIKVTDTVGKLFKLLEPLSSDERQRVVQASFTLLGDVMTHKSKPDDSRHREDDDGVIGKLPARAKTWAKQNGISQDELEQVFQVDDGIAEVITSNVAGKNNKEKTHNAYVLAGIGALLSTGESKFVDKSARVLCKELGCYSDTNHSTYLKDKGNELAGSKTKGWVLTAPGLKRGAAIIKELTSTPK